MWYWRACVAHCGPIRLIDENQINLKNLRSTLNMIVDIKSFVMPYIVYSMAAGGSGLSSLRSKPVTS